MIAILDYGSGNVRSAERAFAHTGKKVVVTSDRTEIERSAGLVIPGVGAFSACMKGLLEVHGDEIIRHHLAQEKPILGICVGMQILFESGTESYARSEESSDTVIDTEVQTPGLALISGTVTRLRHERLPHMGWNNVTAPDSSQLFHNVSNERFYFVHSYAVQQWPQSAVATTTEYGTRFLAAIEIGLISATQFHPEKSDKAGLTLISNWVSTL